MKKLISLIAVAIIVISMSCACGESTFGIGAMKQFMMNHMRIESEFNMFDSLESNIVSQNGPSSYAINIAEMDVNSNEYVALSVFFK